MSFYSLPTACGLACFLILTTASLTAAQSRNKTSQVDSRSRDQATGSLTRFSNMPVVQMQIAGRMRLLAIRTCTYTTILDTRFCKELELKLRRLKGNEQSGVFEPPEFRIGETQVDWISAVRSLDCQQLTDALGHEIAGIIGMEMLSNLILCIDPDKDLVELSFRELSDQERKWQKSDLAFAYGNVPAVLVSLPGGTTELFRLDTSLNCNGTINQALFDRLTTFDESLTSKRSMFYTSDDRNVSDSANISKIKLWHTHPRPLLFRVEEQNRLGNDLLLRYRLSIDFRNHVIYSAPSKLFAAEDGNAQYGIQFDAATGMGKIENVESGSIAQKSGLKAGDKLVSVEGHSVESALFRSYRALCAPTLSERSVVCERDGMRLKFSLRQNGD